MKITKRILKQIIREELENVLLEARQPGPFTDPVTVRSQRRGRPARTTPPRPKAGEWAGRGTTPRMSDQPFPGDPGPRGRGHVARHPAGAVGTGGQKIGGQFKERLERVIIGVPGPRPGPKPWKMPGICRGRWKYLCLLVGATIAGWMVWRDSDEYDESLDPVKTPMYKLFTHCGPDQQLWAFPTKEERQAFMDEIKAAGRLPGCDIPSPDVGPPEMKTPPRENQPGSAAFTPAASPPRPEAPAGECQFTVPPQGAQEWDCFYRALHYSGGGSSGLELLKKYGQDKKWRREHTEAYYELLQSGYQHYNIPTHEELQEYRWYKKVPEYIKDFFKSAQSG